MNRFLHRRLRRQNRAASWSLSVLVSFAAGASASVPCTMAAASSSIVERIGCAGANHESELGAEGAYEGGFSSGGSDGVKTALKRSQMDALDGDVCASA